MTAAFGGTAWAGNLANGQPICLVNYPTRCMDINAGQAQVIGLGTRSAQNWYTEYVGQTTINGKAWNDYYISANSSMTQCLVPNFAAGGITTARCGNDGTAWVWSADANGNDLVSRFYLNNFNSYQNLCASDTSDFTPVYLCSYGDGYFRWANE